MTATRRGAQCQAQRQRHQKRNYPGEHLDHSHAGYSGRPCRSQGWRPALLNSLVVLLVFTAHNFGMALWLDFICLIALSGGEVRRSNVFAIIVPARGHIQFHNTGINHQRRHYRTARIRAAQGVYKKVVNALFDTRASPLHRYSPFDCLSAILLRKATNSLRFLAS